MGSPTFQRARSAENKQRRAESLTEAARALALEHGVRSVTLTAVADRAGVHHSAIRRYFDSHKEVLLQLAADGWNRWADAVVAALRDRQVTPAELAEVLTATLAADPLLCDLFANVPLSLEHDVAIDRVIAFKRTSREAITRIQHAITASAPTLGDAATLDVITATNATAATLWQATHPGPALAAAQRENPALNYLSTADFPATLTRLLTATFTGLATLPRPGR